MITILGALLGCLGAHLSSLLDFFRNAQDNSHELNIFDKQIEMQKLGLSQRTEEIRIQSDATAMVAKQEAIKTGIAWVDALNGTVRPFLVYSYMAMFWIAKIPKLAIGFSLYGVATDMPIDNLLRILDLIWDDNDDGVMAAIISFYFTAILLDKNKGKA